MTDILESKALLLSGKIEEAQHRLADCQLALAQAHIAETDIPRATADVLAAEANLGALKTAHEGIQRQIAEDEDEALQAQNAAQAAAQVRKSKKYRKTLTMADEYLTLFVNTLGEADKIMADLSVAGSVSLRAAAKEASAPLAMATAAKLGEANQQYIENLSRALQGYKTAAAQCKGRGLADMALDASGL
jgi:hypothetical protein